MAKIPLNLWQAFEAAAATAPKRPALVIAGEAVTFAELARLAERCAAWLSRRGVAKGDVVALQLPKRLVAYALCLACLRLGAPYVFLDPRNPPSRSGTILARLSAKVLVAVAAPDKAVDQLLLLPTEQDSRSWLEGLDEGAPLPPCVCHGLDPAYVMFTSGSTGEPKGAVIPHQGVLSLMRWARSCCGDAGIHRFAGLNPLHFDNSVFDLYGGLVNGSTLVPVETTTSANPAHWLRALRDGGASVLFAVPTFFQMLQRINLLNPESLPAARMFIFGGEGYPLADLADFHARFRNKARLINVYGPTETSCICSSHEITDAALTAAGAKFASLGRMHPDFEHAILDEGGTPMAANEIGEMWIGGPNVGLGYYNNPEETARRFRQTPRQSAYRSIWYRTGDLVREDRAGLLWFCGRVDNQVKIRGHRIELEEIDLAVESLRGVRRAIAVAASGSDGLELHLAFSAEETISEAQVRAHCREWLPPYMQPAIIRRFEKLPTNANGKVDRKTLAMLMAQAE